MMETVGKARRAHEGGAVRAAADIGLLVAGCFWIVIQWTFVTPIWEPTPAGVVQALFKAALAVLLGVACAYIPPALIAAILPNTAAGMLLQEQRRTTWFFPVLIGAAGFLCFYAYTIISAWWAAQPGAVGVATSQTIVTLIFTIIIPAWSINYTSPIAWAAEVNQAHLVKKLRLAQQQEILLFKEATGRAMAILRAGLDNATVEQRSYVAGVLKALHTAQVDNAYAITQTMRDIAGVERALPHGDQDIAELFSYVAQAIEHDTPYIVNDLSANVPNVGPTVELRAPVSHQDDQRATAPAAATARPSDRHGTAAGGNDTLAVARRALGRSSWTREDLEEALGVRKTEALDHIKAWRAQGLVVDVADQRFHYSFTEGSQQ